MEEAEAEEETPNAEPEAGPDVTVEIDAAAPEVASDSSMMIIEVECPWDSGPGDVIDVPLPGSDVANDEDEKQTVQVTVPEGIHAGQTFEVELPAVGGHEPDSDAKEELSVEKIAEQLAEWQTETQEGIISCLGEYVQQADFRLIEQVKECLMVIAEAEVNAETTGALSGGWWAQTLRQKFGFALSAEPQVVQALEKRTEAVEQRLSDIESTAKASGKQLVDVVVSLGRTSQATNNVRDSHEELTGVVSTLQRGLNTTIQEEVDDRIGTVIGRTKGELKKEVNRLEARLLARLKKTTANSVAQHNQLEEELRTKSVQLTQLLQQQKATGDDEGGGGGGGGDSASGGAAAAAGGGASAKELKRLESKLLQRLAAASKASDEKCSARIAELESKMSPPK